MSTAKETPADLHAVPNHPAVAMLANGRDSLNRAFKAVERMFLPGSNQLKSLIVIVTTNFTRGHICSSPFFASFGSGIFFP
jgi:hypothetical protein